MPTRPWFALVCIALMVLLPAAMPLAAPSGGAVPLAFATAADGSARGGEAALGAPAEEVAVIEADYAPLTSDLRAPERVELLSALARVLASGAGGLPAHAHRSGAAFAPPARATATWCDLVQCRRQRGAQLLRYATAPPARA